MLYGDSQGHRVEGPRLLGTWRQMPMKASLSSQPPFEAGIVIDFTDNGTPKMPSIQRR